MPEEMIVDDGGGRQRSVKVNYPSNSQKTKNDPKKPLIEEPKPPVEKIITGTVRERKKPIAGRIMSSLIADGTDSIAEYLVLEVLVPAAKDMIVDAFSQGLNRIFYGESRARRPDSRTVHTSYNKISRPSGFDQRRDLSREARAVHDFSDMLFETRDDAEGVLDNLRDIIRSYEVAKITDLYDLVGLTGTFTDDRWGWSDLRGARVRPVRGGYLLDLPKTEPLDLSTLARHQIVRSTPYSCAYSREIRDNHGRPDPRPGYSRSQPIRSPPFAA